MQITKRSPLSGAERTMELDVTQAQLESYRAGLSAGEAFPGLSDAQREFVTVGITPEDWTDVVGPYEDVFGKDEDA